MSDPQPRLVLALVRDLIFASRITASARAASVECMIIRDPKLLGGQRGELLLVDLNEPGAIEAAAAWQHARSRPAIGFVSHVDVERIERARAAGLTRVMARSGFVQSLPALLEQVQPARPS